MALTINQTDLETALGITDTNSKTLIEKIVNLTPGLVVDNAVNVDPQIDFQNSNLDKRFILNNAL